MQGFLPSAIVLGVIAVIAIYLTISRGGIHAESTTIRQSARIAGLTIACQACHFIEEASTGLYRRLPEVFGYPPLTLEFFVTANVVCLVIWVLSTWGLARYSSIGLFPLWFLGLACELNLVIHPALSIVTGGYFPGLYTSPLVGIVGFFMLRRLAETTRASRSAYSNTVV